jgi:hypothetical protein
MVLKQPSLVGSVVDRYAIKFGENGVRVESLSRALRIGVASRTIEDKIVALELRPHFEVKMS